MTAYCVMNFIAQVDRYFLSKDNADKCAAGFNGLVMPVEGLTTKEYFSLPFEDARVGILEA